MKTYSPHRAARGAALLAAALFPASVLAQDTPTPSDPAGAVWFGYESATDAYRSGDDPGAAPADDAGATARPALPMEAVSGGTEPTGTPSGSMTDADRGAAAVTSATPDREVVAVPAPVRKLRDSTAGRRGSEPDADTAAPGNAARSGLRYESAFDAYERYEESEGPDWRGANDRVGEIGGWKTYAREMYESATDGEID